MTVVIFLMRNLNPSLAKHDMLCLAHSIDPNQLASEDLHCLSLNI